MEVNPVDRKSKKIAERLIFNQQLEASDMQAGNAYQEKHPAHT
jgi:hypothetical protein